jgi:hypothetical protein
LIHAAKEANSEWEERDDAVILDELLMVLHTIYCIILFEDEPTDKFEPNFLR